MAHHIVERRDLKKSSKRTKIGQAQQYKRLLEDTSLPELGRDDSDVVIGGVYSRCDDLIIVAAGEQRAEKDLDGSCVHF